MNTISYAINFWSNGDMKALFLRHEGHLGATGAVSSPFLFLYLLLMSPFSLFFLLKVLEAFSYS